jgi:hypothetical protein
MLKAIFYLPVIVAIASMMAVAPAADPKSRHASSAHHAVSHSAPAHRPEAGMAVARAPAPAHVIRRNCATKACETKAQVKKESARAL